MLQKICSEDIQVHRARSVVTDLVIPEWLAKHGSSVPERLSESKPYRVVVLGGAAVGKTCLIERLLHDRFRPEYRETIEDMYLQTWRLCGREIDVEILDTAGAHPFPAMRKLAIKNGDAFVLVFSVDDEDSFETVIQLKDEIINSRPDEFIPIVIVANKSDIVVPARRVCVELADTLATVEWGHGFVEMSAKHGQGVSRVIHEIFRQGVNGHCRYQNELILK